MSRSLAEIWAENARKKQIDALGEIIWHACKGYGAEQTAKAFGEAKSKWNI